MVKGVNKHIIEINDTGNKYFEKVLLFWYASLYYKYQSNQ